MNAYYSKVPGNLNNYMTVMRALCGETAGKSMVDIGCCFAPNTPNLGFQRRTYIDMIERKLDHPEEQQYFCKLDILKINTDEVYFDVAIASDMVEHLTEENGHKLFDVMAKISSRQILFTPTTNLFGMVGPENSDPEAHRSLWYPSDFNRQGYYCFIFPHFHPTWNSGGLFGFRCSNGAEEFERVKLILDNHQWNVNP